MWRVAVRSLRPFSSRLASTLADNPSKSGSGSTKSILFLVGLAAPTTAWLAWCAMGDDPLTRAKVSANLPLRLARDVQTTGAVVSGNPTMLAIMRGFSTHSLALQLCYRGRILSCSLLTTIWVIGCGLMLLSNWLRKWAGVKDSGTWWYSCRQSWMVNCKVSLMPFHYAIQGSRLVIIVDFEIVRAARNSRNESGFPWEINSIMGRMDQIGLFRSVWFACGLLRGFW